MDQVRQLDNKGKEKPWYSFLLIFCGIALNLGMTNLVEKLGLPVYLDCLGTVLAAVMGGYMPGILVGYCTNLLNGFRDVTNIYYGSINALIGVATAFYAAKHFWDKGLRPLLTLPVLVVIGGGLGSVLTWCLFGFSYNPTNPGGALTQFLVENGTEAFFAQLLGDLTADLIDKTLVVLLAILILWLLPKSWRGIFQLRGWWQAPVSEELKNAMAERHLRGLSLRTKVMLLITVAVVLVTLGFTFVFTLLYHNTMLEENATLGKGVAHLAASVIDAESVDRFIAEGEAAPGYLETEAQLQAIRKSSPDIEYIYVYQILPDGCHVVFDLDTDELQGGEPGDLIPFDESFAEYIPALLAGESIEPLISDDTYGWLLTAYQPVYDSTGRCVCYAAVDISMNRLTANEAGFLARVISLSLGVFLVILFLGLWVADYNIVIPINTMTSAADAFAYDSEKARTDSVRRFRALDIHTGDEIENLYGAVGKTMDDTVQYVEDINAKSRTIERMQNGLILVLADMVESRDKCTGDHVRKTAAYAAIILEHMRKLGIYTDQITDVFCQDVVNSAPLHDVGKIQVSDSILNKPGRLTEEEFAVMKNHTVYGRDVIDRVIEMVGDDSGYLLEAKNLAGCHHERWDGKGYPNGLAGEEIPLSARIMAVADVFDALVSRRSYKEPFTFEKAMQIIREGSGTQFDPEVVRAFVDAADEDREVAESFLHYGQGAIGAQPARDEQSQR